MFACIHVVCVLGGSDFFLCIPVCLLCLGGLGGLFVCDIVYTDESGRDIKSVDLHWSLPYLFCFVFSHPFILVSCVKQRMPEYLSAAPDSSIKQVWRQAWLSPCHSLAVARRPLIASDLIISNSASLPSMAIHQHFLWAPGVFRVLPSLARPFHPRHSVPPHCE